MKNPDKIYINVTPLGVDYSIVPIPDFGGVEYIRKDALLEIIEAARESAIVQRNFNNCSEEQEARIDAYDYVMNKIESL